MSVPSLVLWLSLLASLAGREIPTLHIGWSLQAGPQITLATPGR